MAGVRRAPTRRPPPHARALSPPHTHARARARAAPPPTRAAMADAVTTVADPPDPMAGKPLLLLLLLSPLLVGFWRALPYLPQLRWAIEWPARGRQVGEAMGMVAGLGELAAAGAGKARQSRRRWRRVSSLEPERWQRWGRREEGGHRGR
jgi:hypothetical protein